MSLLDEMKNACTMIDRRTVPDPAGGFGYAWVDGATFDATVVKDQSLEARIAEKDGLKQVYTIIVDKNTPLSFHDIFRREEDGQIFRVTSDVKDSVAPTRSTVPIGKVTAEEYILPDPNDSDG